MDRHVAGDLPELDRVVDDACAAIGAEVDALAVPHLCGVVLGGGYGRGEGGAVGVPEAGSSKFEVGRPEGGGWRLSNDLDFFAVAADDGSEAKTAAAISSALEPVSKKWSAELGVDVDFAVKTQWRLKHDEERIMVQELVRGNFDVAGRKGEELFAHIERRPAEAIPWMEAARLLMNRGIGLLLARVRMAGGESAFADARGDFVARNVNKCILGVGDAVLVARRAYRWRAAERAEAFGGALYRAALEWKFRPRAEAVCDWETARGEWLAACEEVFAVGGREGALSRSLREGARWIARRRTLGRLASFGENCVVRILRDVERSVRERLAPSPTLMRDWEIFN